MMVDSIPSDGYEIPPAIYDVGVGWDATPEVERLLFLARQHASLPRTVLELGCGTGRLLRALHARGRDVAGIERSPTYAEFARRSGTPYVQVGDMARFDLSRRFDLVFTSANTIRHILDAGDLARMWRCVADHLEPDGLFIADLEFGCEHARRQVGRPVYWSNSRGDYEVEARWLVEEYSATPVRRASVCYQMTLRHGLRQGQWCTRFPLRVDECVDFAAWAHAGGGRTLAAVYEMRDPYLPETTPERAQGRCLVVLAP